MQEVQGTLKGGWAGGYGWGVAHMSPMSEGTGEVMDELFPQRRQHG